MRFINRLIEVKETSKEKRTIEGLVTYFVNYSINYSSEIRKKIMLKYNVYLQITYFVQTSSFN